MTNPRYRVISEWASVNGAPHRRGGEVEFLGWPKALELTAVNEPARRIAGYHARMSMSPFMPQSPYNPEFGRLYLPSTLPSQSWKRAGWVSDTNATPGMPRYELESGAVEMTRHTVMAGEQFAFTGWPQKNFAPVNDAAIRVAEYFDAHAANPKLLSSPWCELSGLFLPELPAIKRGPGVVVAATYPPPSLHRIGAQIYKPRQQR